MIEPLPGYGSVPGTARRTVIRTAIVYTPLLIGALLATLAALAGGAIVLVVILALVSILLGFQSVGALRDLRSEITETRGAVRRRWSRRNFLFWQSHYIHVGGTIFTIEKLPYEIIKPGDDLVIKHYPHTGTVEGLGIVRPPRPTSTMSPADLPGPSPRTTETPTDA